MSGTTGASPLICPRVIPLARPITLRTLYEAGVVSSMPHGIKLLGAVRPNGSSYIAARATPLPIDTAVMLQGADRFVAKVDVEVTQASASAIAAIEKNGGRIVAGALASVVCVAPCMTHRPRSVSAPSCCSLLQRPCTALHPAAAPLRSAAALAAAVAAAGRRLLCARGQAGVPVCRGARALLLRSAAVTALHSLSCGLLQRRSSSPSCAGAWTLACRWPTQRRSCRSSQVWCCCREWEGACALHSWPSLPLSAGGPVHKAAAMGLEPVTHAGLERLQGSAAAAPDAQVLA